MEKEQSWTGRCVNLKDNSLRKMNEEKRTSTESQEPFFPRVYFLTAEVSCGSYIGGPVRKMKEKNRQSTGHRNPSV